MRNLIAIAALLGLASCADPEVEKAKQTGFACGKEQGIPGFWQCTGVCLRAYGEYTPEYSACTDQILKGAG